MSTKWLLGLTLLAIMFLIIGTALPQKAPSIEGAWKLVHSTFMRNGARTAEFPGSWSGDDMKIWSKGHFTFIGRIRIDTAWNDFYGGG